MERWSSSLIYPVTACALGVAAAFAFAAVAAPVWASFAIGLSTAVGALALRNWWVGEEERPLLAEELKGLYETVDELRSESQELRDWMSEAVEMAEYRISEDAGAPGAMDAARLGATVVAATPGSAEERAEDAARAARAEALLKEARRTSAAQEAQIARLTDRIAALEEMARKIGPGSERPYLDRFEARLDASDARTRKLVHALSIAIEATRRHSEELRRLEGRARADQPPEALAEETASAAPAPESSPTADPSPAIDAPSPVAPSVVPAPAAFSGDASVRSEAMREPAEDAAASTPASADVEEPSPQIPRVRRVSPAPELSSSPSSAAAPARAVLRVQPVFRAESSELRLLEALPEDETAADIDAGALLDPALGLAAGSRRQDGKLAAMFATGLAAFRSDATLGPLLAQLRADPTIAPTLAPSISHTEIAGITDQDFALMRRLADAGVRFALRDVDSAAPDIERAVAAGVRFLVLEAADLAEREEREAGALARLARRLAQRGVTLVLIGVDDPALAALAKSEPGVLAQGDAFAPPRRIRFA